MRALIGRRCDVLLVLVLVLVLCAGQGGDMRRVPAAVPAFLAAALARTYPPALMPCCGWRCAPCVVVCQYKHQGVASACPSAVGVDALMHCQGIRPRDSSL
ncbi:hypothetical protein DFH09DRAFT_1321975 [Mycena vulgaris]|nr:hypothetical protein DFH09DRAFT_1332234 [Mycena vulgaris]KAJ6543787.1 hypothetical protein DFH09DRAFT_1321975 [Mycena vulgaris]